MEQDDNDLVDEATAVRRQLTAACAAVEHANASTRETASTSVSTTCGEGAPAGHAPATY
jgi:hypothetical protein